MEPQEETRTATVSAAVTPGEKADLAFAASGLGLPLSEAMREHSINVLLQKARDFRAKLQAA